MNAGFSFSSVYNVCMYVCGVWELCIHHIRGRGGVMKPYEFSLFVCLYLYYVQVQFLPACIAVEKQWCLY